MTAPHTAEPDDQRPIPAQRGITATGAPIIPADFTVSGRLPKRAAPGTYDEGFALILDARLWQIALAMWDASFARLVAGETGPSAGAVTSLIYDAHQAWTRTGYPPLPDNDDPVQRLVSARLNTIATRAITHAGPACGRTATEILDEPFDPEREIPLDVDHVPAGDDVPAGQQVPAPPSVEILCPELLQVGEEMRAAGVRADTTMYVRPTEREIELEQAQLSGAPFHDQPLVVRFVAETEHPSWPRSWNMLQEDM